MATISSYDSSSISVLFSSIKNNSTGSGTYDLLGINYSDYATIKSGSYYKLMKAYYATEEGADSSSNALSTETSKDSTAVLSSIESDADKVTNAVDKLMKKGSGSVFDKVTKTDKDGNTTTDYDTDAIYKAVNDYVSAYNNLVEDTAKSNTKNIASASKSMINRTAVNEKMLNAIGITVDDDYKLSIDETKFKSADMATVKSIFNTTGGYAYQTSSQASMIHYYAQSEASKSNTYSNSGIYTYNYSTGAIYNATT